MSAPPPLDHPAAQRFILKLARALHEAGAPAHRLEDVMTVIAPRLGLEGQFFSTPTSIFASFGPEGRQSTALVRVEPGGVDLGRLASLDRLIEDIGRGSIPLDEGERRVDAVGTPRYGAPVVAVCFALASATAARFFGGGLREIAVAAAIGLVTASLASGARRLPALARALEPLAAGIAALAATLLGAAIGPYSSPIAALAGIIVLLPGLSLTLAMTELATRHLVAGTARLAGAGMTFLGLGFGLALGARLGGPWTPGPIAAPVELPAWTLWVSLALSPLALTVLFRARFRDAPAILAVGALGFSVARWGSQSLGPELGMFVAALAVGIASNLYARFGRGPAAVPLVPSILLLVPGSLGLHSISSLIERDVLSGIELAFRLVLLAVALTDGLLFSNLAAPPRRAL